MTQRDQILAHLKAGRSITPIEALKLYGCFALSQRIGELKRLGNNIQTVVIRSGRKQYASYQLQGRLDLVAAAGAQNGG